jgi:Mrp family chromosome partitioning ATPase
MDGIVLIVRATSIKRHEAERTVELLQNLGTPVLGTVINGITRDQMGQGYGYGAGYGYGYGYAYGTYGSARSLEEPSPVGPVEHPSNGAPGHSA